MSFYDPFFNPWPTEPTLGPEEFEDDLPDEDYLDIWNEYGFTVR